MTTNIILTSVAIIAANAAVCGMKGPPAINWSAINVTAKKIHCEILLNCHCFVFIVSLLSITCHCRVWSFFGIERAAKWLQDKLGWLCIESPILYESDSVFAFRHLSWMIRKEGAAFFS
jgi:hypothetical protein